MPYVPQVNRPSLDVLIENLRKKIIELCDGDESQWRWLGYVRHAALSLIEETSLNAALQYQQKRGLRYWLVVNHAGVTSNIANELFDRVLSKNPEYGSDFIFAPAPISYMPPVPEDASMLNADIDSLVKEISRISGPEGYNYDGAYNGMDNYSLSELVPRVLMAIADKNPEDPLIWADIEHLIIFWLTIQRELYVRNARAYEDEQILKNGDVKIYGELLEKLPRIE